MAVLQDLVSGVTYQAGFLHEAEAEDLLNDLEAAVPWQQHQVTLFGRTHDCPRLSAWYGDADAVYTYSGYRMQPLPWRADLRQLAERLMRHCGHSFNSVLLNLYRDGNDSMGCHSDDEAELDPAAPIASISLGAARDFVLQRRADKSQRIVQGLEHGSLLLMSAASQRVWVHSLPKRRRIEEARINLTFRAVRPAGKPAQ